MSQVLYIKISVDWSLSGIMTSKLVISESESPRPAASSILISRRTTSLGHYPIQNVIISQNKYNILDIHVFNEQLFLFSYVNKG